MHFSVRSLIGWGAVLALAFSTGPAFAANGARIYNRFNCDVCHGEMGLGGVGPRFRHDAFLAFDNYVIGRILLGGGEMPAFGHRMSNADIAAVASYVRDTWGGQSGQITAEQVKNERKSVGSIPRQETSPQSVRQSH